MVLVHGMSRETRAVAADQRASGITYPEVYFSHPDHDLGGGRYRADRQLWRHILPEAEVQPGKRESFVWQGRPTWAPAAYLQQNPSSWSADDKALVTNLQARVYSVPGDALTAECGAFDVLLPEYDGHVGFLIGTLELALLLGSFLAGSVLAGEPAYDEVRFVCHSMGGLSVRGLLAPVAEVSPWLSVMNSRWQVYRTLWLMRLWDRAWKSSGGAPTRAWSSFLESPLQQNSPKVPTHDRLRALLDSWRSSLTGFDDLRFHKAIARAGELLDSDPLYQVSFLELSATQLAQLADEAPYLGQGTTTSGSVYSSSGLAQLVHDYPAFRDSILQSAVKLVTLATPHEGSHPGMLGLAYDLDDGHLASAVFFQRPWVVHDLNQGALDPQKLPPLGLFAPLGGRFEWGTPHKLWGVIDLMTQSYGSGYWTPVREAYSTGLSNHDLNAFNRAGKRGEAWSWLNPSDPGYFSDTRSPFSGNPVIVDGGPGPRDYLIDTDSTVRLDSALFYHHTQPWWRPWGFFLNHADMKAPLVPEDVFTGPVAGWQALMFQKVQDENQALLAHLRAVTSAP